MPSAPVLVNWQPFALEPGVTITVTTSDNGFNLGLNVGDDRTEVLARRQLLADMLGCRLAFVEQVHGTEVVVAEKPAGIEPIAMADSVVVFTPEVAPVILTADCLPVVFMARDSNGAVAVAVAHAGWRGLCAGVLSNTVEMLRNQSSCDCIEAWLGPCIGPASFEVGEDVRLAFAENFGQVPFAFQPVANTLDKWLADLHALATFELRRIGVSVVGGCPDDTFTDRRWYSHRAWQRGQAAAGRFATVVRLAQPFP